MLLGMERGSAGMGMVVVGLEEICWIDWNVAPLTIMLALSSFS